MDIPQAGGTLIRIVGNPLQDHHFSGISFVGCLYGRTAYLVGLDDIDPGNQMGSGSLKCGKLDAPCLAPQLVGDPAGQVVGSTA